MEIFKKIDNIEYSVSNYGNIKNISTGRILKIKKNTNGYCYVTIKGKSYSVHRLVAKLFLENPNNKPTVNHIDKDKHNNNVINLEWATYSEQKNHSKNTIYSNIRKIHQIDVNSNEIINTFNSLKDAGNFFSDVIDAYKNISFCANNKIKSAYGFKWKYNDYDSIDNEIWMPININDNLFNNYYISNMGRIKNKNRLLKPVINNSGYLSIYNISIHILVAKTFIENPNNYNIVNHIDGNKLNNKFDNLEWTTQSINVIHAINNGLRKNVKKICHIDDDNNIIKIYNSCADASKHLNINTSSINKCCKNELKSCGENKYKFRYLLEDNNIIKNDDKIKKDKKPKKINIYDKDKNFIETLNTITETVKKYKVNNKTIIAHCDGITKYSNLNYYFEYN